MTKEALPSSALFAKGGNMKLTGKHYGIIIFTLATALLHLSLFFELQNKLDPVFLNGFGYLGLRAFPAHSFLSSGTNGLWASLPPAGLVLWIFLEINTSSSHLRRHRLLLPGRRISTLIFLCR
jgi:hypothetical protein